MYSPVRIVPRSGEELFELHQLQINSKYVVLDLDISEIWRITKEALSIVNEPGWSKEQYE